jgi:hypothetical protein
MTKSAPHKVAARKARSARSKTTSKRTDNPRSRNQKTPQKKVAAKLRNNVAAETVRETRRMIDAPLDQFRHSQVTDTLRVLAERNVTQTRELYEGSRNTLQTVLESWQQSFSAAGQNAVALNRKIIDVAERNMDTGFDFAIGLAAARNLGEVMELQAAYWHKVAGALQTQSKTRATGRK